MRDTVFRPDKYYQSMINENNELKEMKQVLIECKLWKDKLNANCKLYKDKVDNINWTNCYARRIIILQPDFLLQKSTLEEAILKARHKCIFYLKFYCELNYIERYWNAAKKYSQENCNYS